MQKLLAIINPAGFFSSDAETKVKPVGVNRRIVVKSRVTARPDVRSRTTHRFALSETTVWWLSSALLTINLVLFVSYLFSVNAQANTGYTMKQLQNKIAEESAENKKLLVKQSEANSIASVQDSLTDGKFVPITAQDLVFVKVNQFSQK